MTPLQQSLSDQDLVLGKHGEGLDPMRRPHHIGHPLGIRTWFLACPLVGRELAVASKAWILVAAESELDDPMGDPSKWFPSDVCNPYKLEPVC